MDLNVEAAARLLGVAEAKLIDLAHEGELPAYRLDGQYHFNAVELQEWASAHRQRITPDVLPAGRTATPSLRTALAAGGIHHGVTGATREQVLAAVARLATIPRGVDRELLYQLLVSREALASTGIGHGIAIPHPRDPLVAQVEAPVLLLSFLAQPVEFGAVDGQPVRVLFTLLAPTIRQHLHLLAKLAWCLHDEELSGLVSRAAPAAQILARVGDLERPQPGSPS